MVVTPWTDNIEEYLKEDNVIDYKNESITQIARSFSEKYESDIEYIKAVYEFVRDNISHSADINEDMITCTASEVLKAGHGICFAKSHLLVALLRYRSVPAGFCYQKLILDDKTAPVLVYHGLNGVYVKEYEKWIRLDARGNTNGIDAQFSIDKEKLAFEVRRDKSEEDSFIVYPDPDVKIIKKLTESKTRIRLWENLPDELGYKSV